MTKPAPPSPHTGPIPGNYFPIVKCKDATGCTICVAGQGRNSRVFQQFHELVEKHLYYPDYVSLCTPCWLVYGWWVDGEIGLMKGNGADND